MQTDYLVVGQGIAGTTLTFRLLESGFSTVVIDLPLAGAASRVAAGLFNPLSGRKAQLTWNYKDFFDQLQKFYPQIEQKLNIKAFYPLPLFRPFETISAQNDAVVSSQNWIQFYDGLCFPNPNEVQAPFGGIKVKGSGYVDWPVLLSAFRDYLIKEKLLMQEFFDEKLLVVEKNSVQYKGIRAKAIVFCQGFFALNNPLTPDLALKPAKGEILSIKLQQKLSYIINKNGWILPHHSGIYKAGSTFWQQTDPQVSDEAVEEIKNKIRLMTKSEFEVLGASAGIRPATARRRPIVSRHRQHHNVFVFNGLGSRGTAIAPLASLWMCDWVLKGQQLHESVKSEVYF